MKALKIVRCIGVLVVLLWFAAAPQPAAARGDCDVRDIGSGFESEIEALVACSLFTDCDSVCFEQNCLFGGDDDCGNYCDAGGALPDCEVDQSTFGETWYYRGTCSCQHLPM